MKKIFFGAILLFGLFLTACDNTKNPTPDGKDTTKGNFGDSIPISNGLTGKVFLLPEDTRKLPDFDTMKPLPTTLFLKKIDVPSQDWSKGFPGLKDRFENFGIEYTGTFRTNHPGKYRFRLYSDDGSKLFIDDSLIINNDGLHGATSVYDSFYVDDAVHRIKLLYFQGPRYQLALQLFWAVDHGDDTIFPGSNFVLRTLQPPGFPWWSWLVAGILLLAVAYWIYRKKRKASLSQKPVAGG